MFLVKVPLELEYQAASFLEEQGFRVQARPNGQKGLVLVYDSGEEVERFLKEELLEAESVIKVFEVCNSTLEQICASGVKVAKSFLSEEKSFGIRCTRRGKHDFTSMDVARELGKRIKEEIGAKVDLETPDFWIMVEILGPKAFIGVVEGKEVRKKYVGKRLVLELMGKVEVLQMPYWGPEKACLEFGERIGRAAQTFEVSRLVIALHKPINAKELERFLKGVLEGIKGRLVVQKKAYNREVRVCEVLVDNIYTYMRAQNRQKTLIIVTDPTGKTLEEVRERLREDLKKYKKILVLCGSREGIPKGIFKMADYVLDLAPGITYATEHAIPAALIALSSVWD